MCYFPLNLAKGGGANNCIPMRKTKRFAVHRTEWLPNSRSPRILQRPIWFMVLFPLAILVLCRQTAFSQCPLLCNGEITIALDSTGTVQITPDKMLQNPLASCTGSFSVNITDTLGNNYGDTANGALIGLSLTATITNDSSGNSCSSNLTVTDNLPPAINCADIFVLCTESTLPDSVGYPVILENVTPPEYLIVSYSDNYTDLGCFSMAGDSVVTALIERTWIATDESGNSDTCTQNVWLLRATLNMVEFPLNLDGFESPPLECGTGNPNDLSVTGQPTINNNPLDNSGDCELVSSFNDQILSVCGGAVKVIRTWIVFDICTEDSRIFVQIIRVNDTQPPQIVCPEDVVFNSFSTSCGAQVWLPDATATDQCSAVTVTPSWEFGSGQGPYNNVPVGAYSVNYLAEDGCGNQSSCTIMVRVKDDDPPTPICQSNVTVPLQEDGTALVFAESFDNGSHDNCGIDFLEVSRDGVFDEFVNFDCTDLNSPVQVTLKVHDANGLVSQCVSNVIVEDAVPPEILCPPTSSLDCGADFANLGLTGQPFATDNCNVSDLGYSDQLNLNTCGIGTITRTWTATDESGNSTSCTMTINVSDNTPLSVSFPDDIVAFDCGFDTDPSATGEPILSGNDCENLGITNTDFIFYTAFPSCYQLVRNWAVIDWCVYQPNDPDNTGFWEHTQTIEVLDNEAPQLNCPADLTVAIQDGQACATFVNLEDAIATDCSEEVVISNDSPFSDKGNANASGVYPIGTHSVTFSATDGCGNTAECSLQLTVVDAQAPSPVCNNGVSVSIQDNGTVTVTPSMIENGSSDNCTPYEDLIFQVSPNTFSCQSLGTQTVTLTVTDANGNSAFCQTTVVVQDNLAVCQNASIATIAGKLAAENNEPLSQMLVGLSGGISIAQHTDIDGTFDFQGLPMGSTYTLTPTYDTDPLNGVTTFDLVLIRRHILGITPFDTPYKIIAADINASGSVTTLDLVELQKLILNVSLDFEKNSSWRFVDASYVFADPSNPLSEPFPESISFENLGNNQFNQDFVGIKVGDVNGNAQTAGFNGGSEDRSSRKSLVLKLENLEFEAGQEYAIPFEAVDFHHILGYQFALQFDPEALEFTEMETGKLEALEQQNFGFALLEEGVLTTSWENIFEQDLDDDEPLFFLKFKAKSNGLLSNQLNISSRYTPAEAYSGSYRTDLNDVEFRKVALEFETAKTERPELYQNQPNPFSENTKIGFYLPQGTSATLHVYDLYGKEVYRLEGNYTAGKHELEVDLGGKMMRSGILLYELETPLYRSQPRKMIVLK